MKVYMLPEHAERADKIAFLRQHYAEQKRRPGKNGAPAVGAEAYAMDQLGVRCEYAVHMLWPRMPWNWFLEILGPAEFEYGNLKIDVKGIKHPDHRLILQRDDDPEWLYVLVSGAQHPFYEVLGWNKGSALMKPEFWKDPTGRRPAYFVPQRELLAPALLHQLIEAQT